MHDSRLCALIAVTADAAAPQFERPQRAAPNLQIIMPGRTTRSPKVEVRIHGNDLSDFVAMTAYLEADLKLGRRPKLDELKTMTSEAQWQSVRPTLPIDLATEGDYA